MTFDEAFLCINNSQLHARLRSAYLDFIISTLVDVNVEESGTTIDNIWHTFVSYCLCSALSQVGLVFGCYKGVYNLCMLILK